MKQINWKILVACIMLCAGLAHRSKAQSFRCPEIEILGGVDTFQMPCVQSACTTISAILPDIRQTVDNNNAYIVEPIPFSQAETFNLPNPNTIFLSIDDRYSNIINLPFTFCYWGNSYNSLVIGANGTITFNTNYANSNSGFLMCNNTSNTYYTLPENVRTSFPLNAIYPLFHDIDPSIQNGSKKIEWEIVGTAPCRRIIMNWIEISHYGCNNLRSTFQCVIYENTNVIDVFVKKKPVCATWNCGVALIGVQNSAGTRAVTAPNRNTSVFTVDTANSEAWRFIPNGASLLQNNRVSLYDENFNLIQAIYPPAGSNGVIQANFTSQICITANENYKKYYVKADYIPCSGGSLEVLDSIILISDKPPAPVASDTIRYCRNDVPAPLTATGSNLLWYDSLNQTAGSPTAPTPSTTTPGWDTFYVSQTVNGCESVKKPIYVQVTDYSYHTINEEICEGDSILHNGHYYSTPVSNIRDTIGRANLCDSILTFNLTIKNKSYDTVTVTICDNQLPYTWNSIVVNSGGNNAAQYTTTGSNGCDSITTLHLITNPAKLDTLIITICEDALPYIWNNNTISQGGTAVATYSGMTSLNCDSIVVLNLIVNDTVLLEDNINICYNQLPYNWRGINVNSGGNGVATKTYNTASGCDSIYNLNLTVTNAILNTVQDSACETQLPYTYNGHTINSIGAHTFTDTFTSSTSTCDSIVTADIFINDSVHTTETITICNNELPYSWNSITVNSGGTNVAVFPTLGINGCDSIVSLNLAVNPVVYDTASITVCETQLPYTWNGISVTNGGNNVATYTTASALNCDSIVSLNLTVINTVRDTVTLNKCENDFPFQWNNMGIAGGGNNVASYTTISSVTQCDSIVTLNVNVIDTFIVIDSVTICETQLPYIWNNISVNNGGTNVASVSNTAVNGCDSLTQLTLIVRDTIITNETISICETQLPYTWNNISINNGGSNVAQYTTPNTWGCDSTTRLNLNIINTVQALETQYICANALPSTWNGINIYTAGNNVATYTTASVITGCDSIVSLNLILKDTFSSADSIFLCENQTPYRFGSSNITQTGSYATTFTAGNGCDSFATLYVQVSETPFMAPDSTLEGCESIFFRNTRYTQSIILTDTFKGTGLCDSAYQRYILTVYPRHNETIDVAVCEGEEYDFENYIYTSDTTFTDVFKNKHGCDSSRTFTLRVHPNPVVTLTTNLTDKICLQQELILTGSGASSFAWYMNDTFYSNDNPFITVVHTNNIKVDVIGTNTYNCTDTASISIVGQACCELGIPNAFSPNGDGLNDAFGVITPGHFVHFNMRIFNRWGALVFQADEAGTQWDGIYNGQPAEMGVYYYLVEYECINGSKLLEKGDLTLIR